MKKKIMIFLFFMFLMSNFIKIKPKIKAESLSNIDVYGIYDRQTVNKNEIIKIRFAMPKFAGVFKVVVYYKEQDLEYEVICHNNECFYLDENSIFDSFIVNKCFDDNLYYAEMLSNDFTYGEYSSYKNVLFNIDLKAVKNNLIITDHLNKNLTIKIYDTSLKEITTNLKFYEKIDCAFLSNLPAVNVFEENIDYIGMVEVLNRDEEEYLIKVQKSLNTSVIGSQIIQVNVYDKVTGDSTSLSTIMEVKDLKPPIIEGLSEINIKDTELELYDFKSSIKISDNYDKKPVLKIKYYDINDNEINELDAKKNLVQNETLIIKCIASDSSGNNTIPFVQKINLIDTIAPNIITDSIIYVNDVDLTNFDILNYISVEDNISKDNKLYISYYNKEREIIDVEKYLTVDNDCYASIYAVDKSGNTSSTKEVIISLVDTTPPIIIGNDEEIINDILIESTNFDDFIKVSDNSVKKLTIEKTYYIEEECNLETFRLMLLKGKTGKIIYKVLDGAHNSSTKEILFSVKDTTPPIIKVNVQDEKIYAIGSIIEVTVSDEISSTLITEIYLNDELYNGEELAEGEYFLKVISTDESNNRKELNRHFYINNDSTLKNIVEGKIKIKNVILISVLCALSIFVIIVEVIYYTKKRKEKLEELPF